MAWGPAPAVLVPEHYVQQYDSNDSILAIQYCVYSQKFLSLLPPFSLSLCAGRRYLLFSYRFHSKLTSSGKASLPTTPKISSSS